MKRTFINPNIFYLLTISGLFQLFIYNLSFAEIPQKINYQGKLTNIEGRLVADGSYDMVFSIYDAEEGGNQEWIETWDSNTSSVPVTNGIFNVLLGTHEPLNIPFDENYWLEIQVKFNDTYETLSPRQQIVSV